MNLLPFMLRSTLYARRSTLSYVVMEEETIPTVLQAKARVMKGHGSPKTCLLKGKHVFGDPCLYLCKVEPD
jgi:hypothetical protein